MTEDVPSPIDLRLVHDARVKELLAPGGCYLACDHYCGPEGMQNDRLYMTVDEQRRAIALAGFSSITELLRKGGMVLHRAMCTEM